MLRYLLLFFSLAACVTTAYGQDKIIISGKISDKSSHEPVPFVHIINQTNGTGVASSVDGSFNIKIDLGDTLIFSAVGFSKHSLVVTKQLKEVYLNIKLDPEAMELQTINVFAYRDLASLKRAIVEMDMPVRPENELTLNIPPPSDHASGSGLVIGGPISSLINGLGMNKRFNELQKYNQLQVEQQKRQKIERKYNAVIVKEWTGLPDEKVDSFMKFCKLSDDYIIRSTEYELAVAVHQCLDDFNKFNED